MLMAVVAAASDGLNVARMPTAVTAMIAQPEDHRHIFRRFDASNLSNSALSQHKVFRKLERGYTFRVVDGVIRQTDADDVEVLNGL